MNTFNPYQQWLGIDGAIAQPNHYQLLGIPPGASDPAAIAQAADRAINRVRSMRPGEHAGPWSGLLDELKQAKACLLDPVRRAQYDRQLSSAGVSNAGANPMAPFMPAMPASPSAPAIPAVPASAAGNPMAPFDAAAPRAAEYVGNAAPQPSTPDPMAPVSLPGVGGGCPAYPAPGGPHTPAAPQHGASAGQPAPWTAQNPAAGYAAGYPSPPAPAYPQPPAAAYGQSPNPMAPVARVPRAIPSSPNVPTGNGFGAGYGHTADSAYAAGGGYTPGAPLAAAAASQTWPDHAEAQPQVRSRKTSTARAAAERARRAQQTYLGIALGAGCVLLLGGIVILALGGFGDPGNRGNVPVAQNGAARRPAARAPARPAASNPRPTSGRPVGPFTAPANPDPAGRDPGTWPASESRPVTPRPSEPGTPLPAMPAQDEPLPGEPRPDPSFLPDPPPAPTPVPVSPVPDPEPEPSATPVPAPAPEPVRKPLPPPMPTAEELKQLGRELTAARSALADLKVDAADAALARAEPLARLPEHKQKYDRLLRLADYVRRFRGAMVEAFGKLNGGDSIMVGSSTQVGVVETFSDKIIVRVAGMNKTYAMDELPVGLASAIVDQVLPQSPESLLIKGAYVAVSRNSSELHRETARGWWRQAQEMGGEVGDLAQFFDDDYDFQPGGGK